MSLIGGAGFHNSAVVVIPQDIAPVHSGSVFGLMNTFGSVPGINGRIFLILSTPKVHSLTIFLRSCLILLGFLGVYLAGHILELTQSWSAVFSTAALINTIGWIAFTVFGSSQKII